MIIPLLGEIWDKMPHAVEYLHFWAWIALFATGLTLGLSWTRSWLGGCVLGMMVFLAILNAFGDTSMDELIVRELGQEYLFVRKASGLLPVVAAWMAWWVVHEMRRNSNAHHDCNSSVNNQSKHPQNDQKRNE